MLEYVFDIFIISNQHDIIKAKFIATSVVNPVHQTDSEYPLILNTGRIRDQWHTMSRTGLSANLANHRAEPYCEIHPNDALKYGIGDKALVEVRSKWGVSVLRAQLSNDIRRGQVFAPIHWNDQVASDARIGKVVNPVVDAISGEPEFKHTPVMIQPFYTQWQGVFYVRDNLYAPYLRFFLKHKLLGFAIPIALLIISIGALGGGVVKTSFSDSQFAFCN